MAARLEYERGNGSVNVDGRFERIEGDNDEGAYQTADYDDAGDRILIRVDGGNGRIVVSEP
jgi:hypothetical protein